MGWEDQHGEESVNSDCGLFQVHVNIPAEYKTTITNTGHPFHSTFVYQNYNDYYRLKFWNVVLEEYGKDQVHQWSEKWISTT